MTDKQRRDRNKALIKKRTEEQQEAKRKRMARNKRVGKEYLNQSAIWSPTEVHIWR